LAKRGANFDDLVLADECLHQRPGMRGGNLGVHLVGGHFQQGASASTVSPGATSRRLIVASATSPPRKGNVMVTQSSLIVTPFQ
jgi:hypothetical protein